MFLGRGFPLYPALFAGGYIYIKKRLILLILCGWYLEKEGWRQFRTMLKLIIWSLHSQRKVLHIFKGLKISGLSHGLILFISLKRFKPYKPLLWLRLQETFSFTSNLRPLKFGSNEIIVIVCKKVDFTKHRRCYSKKLKYLFLIPNLLRKTLVEMWNGNGKQKDWG